MGLVKRKKVTVEAEVAVEGTDSQEGPVSLASIHGTQQVDEFIDDNVPFQELPDAPDPVEDTPAPEPVEDMPAPIVVDTSAAKFVAQHEHCPNCGACLINGEGHVGCVPPESYSRSRRFFARFKPRQ